MLCNLIWKNLGETEDVAMSKLYLACHNSIRPMPMSTTSQVKTSNQIHASVQTLKKL